MEKRIIHWSKKPFNKIVYEDNEILKFLIESPKHENKIIIIDKEDFLKIKSSRWCIQKISSFFYVVSGNRDKRIYLHRILLEAKLNEFVDHKDHNTLDNRKKNLRKCSKAENPVSLSSSSCGKTWSRSILNVPRIRGSIKTAQNAMIAFKKL